MTDAPITLSIESGLARLALNQPARGNPFDAAACREFGLLANRLASRADVRAVLLTAQGKYFSVGGDLGLFSSDLDAAPAAVLDNTQSLHMGMARLARMNAPIVACVQGAAMGGAVAILANCDLVYSARSARFGAAYSHIGFTCDLGASYGLASRMGISRAKRFLLLGEVLEAAQAERVGLVDFVVDDAVLSKCAEQAAIRLGQAPQRHHGAVRRLLPRVLDRPLEVQLQDQMQELADMIDAPQANRGSVLQSTT
ncbi:MAG: hypothetical protein JWQ90_4350 [Hydrocarboniphaga sp.]|uniref:enoyl-CoA hydratase/isomerase family protein n=1 Tax=Hydrocarboniphaga sp. TaxID=2033016 RepID=UPI00261B47B9|nr:enoyl-CoA hydratase/isomerase family protein [Hydrocarboniphaga sp.]MDB5971900.1 hypothetical protein [Hydrocarboniphaga sp.]